MKPAEAAHDVAELLEAEVAGESSLGHHVVRRLQRNLVRQDRVGGVRDVPERARVDQRRLPFERLHDVRLDGFLHDHGHGAAHPQHVGRHRLARVGAGHHDPAEPLAQVLQVGGQRERGHHFGCGRDHELVLARHAVRLAAQTHHAVAQLAVVHVDGARPDHAARVDAERVAVEDRRVERRRQQVVRLGHGVEVAVEVEVDVLHRSDLRVAAARAAALHAEHRAHRGLAQAQHHLLVDLAEAHRQRHARRGLALAGLGRRDRGDDDELAVLLALQTLERGQADLAAILAALLQLVGLNPGGGGNLGDGTERGLLGDFER